MTFIEAQAAVKKLAGERYYSMAYEIMDYANGNMGQTCSVCIGGGQYHRHPTWAGVIAAAAGESPVEVESIEEL